MVGKRKNKGFTTIEAATKKNKRISVIAVRNSHNQLLNPFYFKGSTNKEVFKTYLAEILLPNLPKSSYLIMDNAVFYKREEIENLIRSANINLIYLPTYSPWNG